MQLNIIFQLMLTLMLQLMLTLMLTVNAKIIYSQNSTRCHAYRNGDTWKQLLS